MDDGNFVLDEISTPDELDIDVQVECTILHVEPQSPLYNEQVYINSEARLQTPRECSERDSDNGGTEHQFLLCDINIAVYLSCVGPLLGHDEQEKVW